VYATPHPPFLVDEFRGGPPAVHEGLRLTRLHQRYILFRRAQGDSVAALAAALNCEKSAVEYHLRRAYEDPGLFRELDFVMPWRPPDRASAVYFCRYCAWTEARLADACHHAFGHLWDESELGLPGGGEAG
jgi:hypothetical protein